MTSTYTLNQGLEKPATGDRSGTWGTMTNTNMDILDRAISGVGTLSLTGTTTTLTTSDGSASDGNYKVLVLGGSPSGTNTITLSPNDGDKLYFVVNSSGQSVIFSQGTGANVTIANGAADIIYADGAGSGAAVASVLAKNLVFAGDIDVDGTANLDAVDIDGAVQIDSTVTVGVDDTGYDVKFFGDTASAYMLWDTATDDLVLAGAAGIDLAGDLDVDGTANLDAVDIDGAVQIDNTVTVGVDDTGYDVKFFGATAGKYALWDESADSWIISGTQSTVTAGVSNYIAGVNAGNSIASGGNYNTLVGDEAGTAITTGDQNVAVGYQALDANETSIQNTAIGDRALTAHTGLRATAVGCSALAANTTDGYGVAVGYAALTANTTGTLNTAVGSFALTSNDGAGGGGDYNTAMGYAALYTNSEGSSNTGIGYYAGFATTTGTHNTAIGYNANGAVTDGDYNTGLGSAAGDSVTTGTFNVCVGYATDVSAVGAANQISIGTNISCSEDSQVTIGKSGNVVRNEFDTDAAWSQSSDVRKKKDIEDAVLGLDFVNDLRPVTYEWKPNNEFPEDFAEYSEENHMTLGVKMHGLVAQEVKVALDKTGVDRFSGWKEDPDGSQRISKEMFVIPLIKAVKELSAKNDALEARIAALESA